MTVCNTVGFAQISAEKRKMWQRSPEPLSMHAIPGSGPRLG